MRRERKTGRGGAGRILLAGTLAAALGVATVAVIRSAQRSPRVARALPPREVAATFTERTAFVQGVQMRWLEHGQGYPVVLVHGIPTSPELWRRVLPRLRGARALAWEMVGYGASIPEGKGRDISVARQADYLAAWLRQLGIDRAVLVGHDLGGGGGGCRSPPYATPTCVPDSCSPTPSVTTPGRSRR